MWIKEKLLHVCLAGRNVSNDWPLIQTLKSRHHVTVVEHIRWLSRKSVLVKVDVLVLDCHESRELGLRVIPLFRRHFPRLCIVVVDGGLNQHQIAAAFHKGAQDYFADPYDVSLLVERVHALGINAKTNRQHYDRFLPQR